MIRVLYALAYMFLVPVFCGLIAGLMADIVLDVLFRLFKGTTNENHN